MFKAGAQRLDDSIKWPVVGRSGEGEGRELGDKKYVSSEVRYTQVSISGSSFVG